MREILTSEISILAFTLGIYFGATLVYQKTKFALLHPVLVTIAVIIAILLIFKVDYLIYQKGSHLIDFMLGPSVVALGYTLYTQIASIKENLVSILTALFVGSITGIGSVLMLAKITWQFSCAGSNPCSQISNHTDCNGDLGAIWRYSFDDSSRGYCHRDYWWHSWPLGFKGFKS